MYTLEHFLIMYSCGLGYGGMESISATGSVALLLHPFRHTTPPPPQPPTDPHRSRRCNFTPTDCEKTFLHLDQIIAGKLNFYSLTLSVQLFYIVKVYVAALAAFTLLFCSLHVFNCYPV